MVYIESLGISECISVRSYNSKDEADELAVEDFHKGVAWAAEADLRQGGSRSDVHAAKRLGCPSFDWREARVYSFTPTTEVNYPYLSSMTLGLSYHQAPQDNDDNHPEALTATDTSVCLSSHIPKLTLLFMCRNYSACNPFVLRHRTSHPILASRPVSFAAGRRQLPSWHAHPSRSRLLSVSLDTIAALGHASFTNVFSDCRFLGVWSFITVLSFHPFPPDPKYRVSVSLDFGVR